MLEKFCGWGLNGVVPLKVEDYDLGVEGFDGGRRCWRDTHPTPTSASQ